MGKRENRYNRHKGVETSVDKETMNERDTEKRENNGRNKRQRKKKTI